MLPLYLLLLITRARVRARSRARYLRAYARARARDVKKIYIFSLKGVPPPTWDKMSQVPGTKCPRFGIIFQQYVEKKKL